MGVQLRVQLTASPVVEQGHREPLGSDLLDAVGPAPRPGRVRVEVGQAGLDHGPVRGRRGGGDFV